MRLRSGTVGETARPLGATLAVPRVRGATRLPALAIVGGSGPTDRDCTMQGARPYRDLAQGLARKNVISLRFDKRPFTYPRQYAGKVVTVEEELLADAVSAVNTLRTRPEVDPRRLFVLGHSLGGLLPPEIAQRAGDIAGLILLAAPGPSLASRDGAVFRSSTYAGPSITTYFRSTKRSGLALSPRTLNSSPLLCQGSIIC